MVEVGTFDVDAGALGYGSQFLDGGFTAATPKTLVALTQGFRDGAGHGSPVSWAIGCASLCASGSLTLRLVAILPSVPLSTFLYCNPLPVSIQ